MELVRVVTKLANRASVVRAAGEHTVLFRCSDANTVVVAASLAEQLRAPFGVWLEVDDGYSAQLCARDVATLATIIPLRHVVIEARSKASAHADVVRALLTNDEVNFTNDVVNLVGAFNRPAPPQTVTVWSFIAGRLVNGDVALVEGRSDVTSDRTLTFFV